jgi:protein-S-isoprenylcysteine O-methyltransferase Ste14
MRQVLEFPIRILLLAAILCFFGWASAAPLPFAIDVSIIVLGVMLTFPVVWLGRIMLDKRPTSLRAIWITTIVHYTVVVVLGIAIIRALKTHRDWSGWVLPIPEEVGLLLVIVTGGAALLSVINLALKGLGAPFAVALSRKLAVDWLYAWTRNPMVLATLALGLSLGVWFQSLLFVLWVVALVAPALLVIVKVFEERELEIRFGASYLEYRSRTPLLFPRRPRA